MARYGAAGLFWKAVPKQQRPEDPHYLKSIEKQWVELYRDMRQELVFIGQGLDKNDITQRLNHCLLSEEEVLLGGKECKKLPDQFPVWELH